MSAGNYLIRLYTFLPQVLIPGQSIQTATLTPQRLTIFSYIFLSFYLLSQIYCLPLKQTDIRLNLFRNNTKRIVLWIKEKIPARF